jgi:pimeloyl-ACP methyl ester carboxylesterase
VSELEWASPRDHPSLRRGEDPREEFAEDVYRACVGDDPEWTVGDTSRIRPDLKPGDCRRAGPRHHRARRPHDNAAAAHAIVDALPVGQATLEVFERSAHRPWAEEPELYFELVQSFLGR